MAGVLFHAGLRFRINEFATGLQGTRITFASVKPEAMRIGIIDKVVFAVVANTSVEELRKEHPEWKACSIKKNARPRYFKMIKETPEDRKSVV